MILISESQDEVIFMLNSGIRFRVSPQDKMLVLATTWKLSGAGYLHGSSRDKYRGLFLHRLICPDGEEGDHKDLDPLNCRRDNLRPATISQNRFNSGMRSTNTSGYKGVSLDHGRWRAAIQVKGNWQHLGSFDTPELAYAAYCEAAKKHFGEFYHE